MLRSMVAPGLLRCRGAAVRFAYEWQDDPGNWFRFYGNENKPQ